MDKISVFRGNQKQTWLMNKPQKLLPTVMAFICFAGILSAKEPYDLAHVDGIEMFGGSAQAQALLSTNGFAVAAPDFKQIFQPYIESPLPVFVTPDSAWHTYHFLLEQGLKGMEYSQSERLEAFSRRLLAAASAQAGNGVPEFRDLARYASVGLAFQDAKYAASLEPEQKRLVDALSSGSKVVEGPIGFPLSAVAFRAQSFYAESPELTGYYHARQWYANVDFRLADERETHLAICLSWLVQSDPELLKLWRALTTPYDVFLAPPEDATVNDYFQIITNVTGTKFGLADLNEHSADILKKIRANPKLPRINDQQLSPAEYLQFPQLTAGFRLLPARQLPCAVCLQNTVDPKIPGRLCPSGLDFFAGAATLRSPAALRAEENLVGKAALAKVLAADPGLMPDSLYGQSMMLLTNLEKPLPSKVPAPFHTSAWSDLQLFTQLGAWAEQRHTWALHAKPDVEFMGMAETPPGIVAPYPDFFSGLARLSRQTELAFKPNLTKHFDPKQVAMEMLRVQTPLAYNISHSTNGSEMAGKRNGAIHGCIRRVREVRCRLSRPTSHRTEESGMGHFQRGLRTLR